MSAFHDLRAEVLEANLAIVAAGLVRLTFGNVSGADREAGVMAIKPSGVPYDELTPDAIVVVDLDDGTIVAGEARPSSDTPTHLVLYRSFPGLGGIVHTHSPYATAWAQATREVPCFGTTHADHFFGPVPVTRQLTPAETGDEYEQATGEVVVETFARLGLDPLERPAALVASHGPFVWGPSPKAAVENAVALETVAEVALRTEQLRPGAPPISSHLLERHFHRKHGPTAYYGQHR